MAASGLLHDSELAQLRAEAINAFRQTAQLQTQLQTQQLHTQLQTQQLLVPQTRDQAMDQQLRAAG